MFRALYATSIFLSTVIFKIIVSDQQSLSNAKCDLLNTCSARMTDYLASERSKTPKINDKEPKSNTQSTSDAIDESTLLPTYSQVSLGTKQEPLRETTSSSYTSLDAKSYTTSPLTTANKVTSEVAEESTVTMTTADALKSTQDTGTSEGYTIRRVAEFQPECYNYTSIRAISVMDFIYVLCEFPGDHVFTVQAYDASAPHDLLMITVVVDAEEIGPTSRFNYTRPIMVGIENTNGPTLYIGVRKRSGIRKIGLDNNIVGEWLSELDGELYLSVGMDNHLLLLRVSDDVSHLDIYAEDANLVRSVSLSSDFKAPLHAIQKPNGEFIVSHRSKEDNSMCVSFLSIEGKLIEQFNLKETIGFRDAELFYARELEGYTNFAIEVFSGNVYILDENTFEWNLTGHRAIFSNSSEESHRKIVGIQSTDGRTFTHIEQHPDRLLQFAELFYDTEDEYLFAVDNIFGDLYQFETNTLKCRQIHVGNKLTLTSYYEARTNQFISALDHNRGTFLEVWAFVKI